MEDLTLKKLPDPLQSRLDETCKAYRAFLRSPNGKIILADLRRKFYDKDLAGDAEHSTSLKVGRHSVVLHILKMAEQGVSK